MSAQSEEEEMSAAMEEDFEKKEFTKLIERLDVLATEIKDAAAKSKALRDERAVINDKVIAFMTDRAIDIIDLPSSENNKSVRFGLTRSKKTTLSLTKRTIPEKMRQFCVSQENYSDCDADALSNKFIRWMEDTADTVETTSIRRTLKSN